jgi:CheY-like chemotaxis protein
MASQFRRALLFVVDDAGPMVELVASLFGAGACTLAVQRPRAAGDATGWQGAHALTRLLRQDGYQVGVMIAGADAKRRLAQAPAPDALIADISRSEGDCLAVARHARRLYPNLPVLIVTNHPELVCEQVHGLDPEPIVFPKPLDYASFGVALRRAARKHSGQFVRMPPAFVALDRKSWPGVG